MDDALRYEPSRCVACRKDYQHDTTDPDSSDLFCPPCKEEKDEGKVFCEYHETWEGVGKYAECETARDAWHKLPWDKRPMMGDEDV